MLKTNSPRNFPAKNAKLTAEDEEPELSPLCITRTLHLTLPFLCFTPNWVQMRTMMGNLAVVLRVSLSSGLVLKSLRSLAPLAFRAVWALLGSPLNTRAAAPPSFPTSRSIRPRGVTELSPDPPISSRAAGDAGVLSALGEELLALGRWSRGCCSLPFPSRDLFPEFFKADLSSHDSVHRVLFFFSFHRQNRHSYEKELISAVCPDKLQTEHTLLGDGAPVLECHFCI